jgi:hypothetical protein
MAVFTLRTGWRGWIRNAEENEIVHRKDHPHSFTFLQLLQIAGVAILLCVGWKALHGWN